MYIKNFFFQPVAQNDVSSRATESNDDLPCVLNKNNELVNAANRVFVDGWSHSVTNTSIGKFNFYLFWNLYNDNFVY